MALNNFGLGFQVSGEDAGATQVFGKVGAGLDGMSDKARKATQAFEGVSKKYSALGTQMIPALNAQQLASKAAQEAQAKTNEAALAQQKMHEELVKKSAEAAKEREKTINARSAAMAIAMKEASDELSNMGGKLKDFGANIEMGLVDAAVSAGTFNASIAKAGAFTGATAKQMEQLRAAAQNANLVMMGFSFEDQSATLAQLANELGNVDDAIAELIPSLRLAKITGMEGAQAAGFLSDVVSGFKMEASQAGDVVDKFAFSMKKFGLTANELEGAMMPTIGAAQLLGQSFDDTIAIVGIANSGLGNVKKSAMAATLAMNQLADPDMQAKISALGVAVKDSSGKFRSMVDILGDVSEKTKGMTEAQRAQTIAHIFGAKGAGGLNVVMDQLTQGIKGANGELLKGAAAVKELRNQMANAAGSGEDLALATAKTLPEAQLALVKAFSSLKTAIGGPVEEMLVPVVKAIAGTMAKVANFFTNLSPGIKKMLVGVVAGIGIFASFMGTILASAGAVAALILAGKALLIGLGAVAAVVGVVMVALVPLIAVAGVLYTVWTKNIGGIQERVTYWFDKIKLAFTALYQVFTSGGFSMAVFDELNKAENSGIKAFAINAFLWFNRIKNFFSKIGESFSAGMDRVAPVIDRIFAGITKLAGRFGMTSDAASKNKDAFDKWGNAGAKVGDFLVTVVDKVARILVSVISLIDGAVSVFQGFKPTLSAVWDAASDLFGAFKELFGLFSVGGDASMGLQDQVDLWSMLGKLLGFAVNNALLGITAAIRVLGAAFSLVSGAIGAVTTYFSGMVQTLMLGIKFLIALFSGDWGKAWDLAKQTVITAAQTILQTFLKLVAGAAGMVDQLGKIFKVDIGLKSKVEGVSAAVGGPGAASVATPALPASTASALTASPASASAAAAASQNANLLTQVASKDQRPIELNNHTTLNLDGKVLQEVVNKQNTQDANRSFAPSPATANT